MNSNPLTTTGSKQELTLIRVVINKKRRSNFLSRNLILIHIPYACLCLHSFSIQTACECLTAYKSNPIFDYTSRGLYTKERDLRKD